MKSNKQIKTILILIILCCDCLIFSSKINSSKKRNKRKVKKSKVKAANIKIASVVEGFVKANPLNLFSTLLDINNAKENYDHIFSAKIKVKLDVERECSLSGLYNYYTDSLENKATADAGDDDSADTEENSSSASEICHAIKMKKMTIQGLDTQYKQAKQIASKIKAQKIELSKKEDFTQLEKNWKAINTKHVIPQPITDKYLDSIIRTSEFHELNSKAMVEAEKSCNLLVKEKKVNFLWKLLAIAKVVFMGLKCYWVANDFKIPSLQEMKTYLINEAKTSITAWIEKKLEQLLNFILGGYLFQLFTQIYDIYSTISASIKSYDEGNSEEYSFKLGESAAKLFDFIASNFGGSKRRRIRRRKLFK